MRRELKCFDDLCDFAGNGALLAGHLNVHQYTMDRWKKNGIPYKYLKQITEICNVSLAELMHLNNQIVAKNVNK